MKKIILIIILVIVSVFLIFYRFVNIPKNLSFDEVEFTKLALSLDKKPYVPYSELATGHSTLYFYGILLSLKSFGINSFALRLPAAIFGILSIFFFYLVIGRLKNYQLKIRGFNFLPFALSLILLTTRWFINFSRFSFEVTFLLFLELASIYFLIKSDVILRRNKVTTPESSSDSGRAPSSFARMTYLAISGLFAGLAFISYTPGRIFFLLPVVYLLYKNKFKVDAVKQLLYFIVPFIIVITPLTTYLMTHQDTRIDQQFFLNNHEMPVQEKISGLWNNISSTALMFNVKGDVNGRHNYPNKPALNPLLGILFIIGFFISIKNLKNRYNKLFVFYFFLSLLPAIMTYSWENPNMLRTYTTLPSIIYFIGNAIIFLYTVIEKKISHKNKSLKYLILNIFYFLLIFSCFYELRTYFKYQSIVFNQAFEIKLPLEKAIKIKNP